MKWEPQQESENAFYKAQPSNEHRTINKCRLIITVFVNYLPLWEYRNTFTVQRRSTKIYFLNRRLPSKHAYIFFEKIID